MRARHAVLQRAAIAIATAFAAAAVAAPVVVLDDSAVEVRLARPAQRIVSLAPHATELLFAVGAGERVVATVEHADHPEAARRIPRVGSASMLDLERIVALRPDLIVVWLHGNAERHLDKVRRLGIPVFHSQPKTLADVASSLQRLGRLAGTEAHARRAAERYTAQLEALRRAHAHRAPVRVFFQAWKQPLLTINGTQIISDVIRLCGGRNVFEDAPALVPAVSAEAVASADPEAIVSTGRGGDDGDELAQWRSLARMRASANGNLILLPTPTLGRHSPRVLEGAAMLCHALEGVRARRRP
jgi:iron complex transport system substrate-binding protein